MLSGPAILRISVLLILAGILAALVQFLLPSPVPPPAPAPPLALAPVYAQNLLVAAGGL
ncbi:hypothetical protein [Methylobacterium sp. GXS13]|uniref:hypothetical protein n=1 Tax=Methylobacterium sp. GXS13 TaxID=1730094 RepID=UPI000B2BC214|nr:hypothetical protein [Methylobacterium sp. GXS13]